MKNAKEELLKLVADVNAEIIAAEISFGQSYEQDDNDTFVLYPQYTEDDYNSFLKFLDRMYDDDYGLQVLEGTIWFSDGTYADRGEYDGSEWWEYRKCPELPVRKE